MAGSPADPGAVPWWNVLGHLRAAVRSPYYRAERRQGTRVLPALGGTGLALLIFLSVTVVCCFFAPLVLGGLTALLPGFMAAEGLVGEIEGDTLDSLLLTPSDRATVLWAKLAARLRGWTAMAAATVLLGTPVLFALAAFVGSEPDAGEAEVLGGTLAWGCAGLAAGAIGSILVAGQTLTGGALATALVLQHRGRASTYTMVSLAVAGLTMVESVLWALTATLCVVLGGVLSEVDAAEPWQIAALVVLIAAGVFALRVLVLNWLVPAMLMRYSARNMDRLLLVGR